MDRLTPALVATLLVGAGCSSKTDVLFVGAWLAPEGGDAPTFDGGGLFDSVCTPAVEVQNMDPTGGGKVFTDDVPDPVAVAHELTHSICSILFRKTPEVPVISKITIVIVPLIGISADILVSTATVRLNSSYLQTFASSHTASETTYEIDGLLVYTMSLFYQDLAAPAGVVQGVADFVRYRAGYWTESARSPGGNWDDGFQTTAFFFDYVDKQSPSFVYRLNQAIGTGYSVDLFVTLTGKDVITLWNEYQATF